MQKLSMKEIEGKKTLLWDFDGVIVDSQVIRDKGFTEVLRDFPTEEVEKLLAFHRENGGLSRYVKFRYFFEEIRKEKIPESRLSEMADRFSEIMRLELIKKEYLIPETLSFIQKHYETRNMHIISGSDGEELRFLCNSLGIARYFISIEGSPTPKQDLVQAVLENYSYSPSETVLIGDAINDFHAAEKNGVDFLGYNNRELKNLGAGYINSFF